MVKVVFIGGGNMAEALLKGSLATGVFKANDVIVTDIKSERLAYIEKVYKVKTSSKNVVPVEAADIVLLAVKPQNMAEVLKELKSIINKDKLVVSIAAGVTIKQLQQDPSWKVVRVMPNTPALIGQGISALCGSATITKKDMDQAERIFKAVGATVQVDENNMNAVTALSGSGPAFVYRIAEYMMQGGQKVGLSEKVAKELTLQTLIGAANMIAKTGESPDALVRKVASPGGTTVAGLDVLDRSSVKTDIIKTIEAAKQRADELSKGK